MHKDAPVCGQCRHFRLFERAGVDTPQEGHCKRYAPRPALADGDALPGRQWAAWPMVRCDESACGELELRRNPADEQR